MHHRKLVLIALASIAAPSHCLAQAQPATIPTVLAQALSGYFGGPFGVPRYVVGTPPAGFPSELIPAKGRVIGGGVFGDPEAFLMRTLVVEMPVAGEGRDVLRAMATRAGYATRSPSERDRQGFLESPGASADGPLCKASRSLFAFSPVDSIGSPRTFALHYLEGEGARQNCDAAERSRSMSRGGAARFGPSNLPFLAAPRGVAAFPGGSSWSGTNGENRTTLRTTMPVDSILSHYTAQLVAAGWKTDGSQLANQSVGIQKFTFRDGEEPWSAALIIMAVGDRRDMGLRLSKVNGEY